MPRVHAFLLRIACLVLPASFRQDYQREIMLVFREELSSRSGASGGAIRVWLSLLPDLIETAIREHAGLFKSDLLLWLRFVGRRKAFAAGLIGNFAVSIALASAMFSVTYALLLRSLPYHDPDRIVRLENFPAVLAQSNPGVVRDWLKTQKVFEDLAYYSPWGGNLEGEDRTVRVKAASVSGSFFGVFGQSVLLGSDFDESSGAFAVLGEQVWQDVFGGDPTVVGRTIRVNGEQLRVNGVMRPGFRFPESTQVWTYTRGDETLSRLFEEQQAVFTFVAARRESSVAPPVDSGPEISYPLAERPPGFLSLLVRVHGNPLDAVRPIQQAIRDEAPQATVFDARPMTEYVAESLTSHRLYALILGTFAILSTATSIAGLMSVALFYVSSRRQELGIRLALGASMFRLTSLVARQGMPLLFAGVLVGEVLACAGGRGIAALLAGVQPLDPAVHLAVSTALLLSGILAMLICSLKVIRLDPNVTLRAQ